MTKQRAILILFLSAVWWVPHRTEAGEPTVDKRAIALLQPIGKRVMTEAEAKEVASLGPSVLPVVYDALFSKNDFEKGYWETYALRVLAHTGNKNVIPKIREYIDRDAELCRRFEALRAVLEIDNTTETRSYIVEMCNHWMTHDRYRLAVESGFCRLLDADIPPGDMVGIVNRTALDKFIFRAQIFRQLARRSDDISIPILKHLLASSDPTLVSLVDDCIRDGIEQLEDEARKYSSLDNFVGAQQPITKQDIDRRHAEIVACITRLEKEFFEVASQTKDNKMPEDTPRKLVDPQH